MGGFYCGNKKIRIADSSKGMFGKSYFFGVRPSRGKAGQTSERTTAEGNFMEGIMAGMGRNQPVSSLFYAVYV